MGGSGAPIGLPDIRALCCSFILARLGDFWCLHLVRPKREDFERGARRMVRTAR